MSEAEDQLQTQYKRAFGDGDGQAVLRDLAQFCNVGTALPIGTAREIVSDVESMRRVFWHVYHMVYTTPAAAKLPKKAPAFDFNINPFEETLRRTA